MTDWLDSLADPQFMPHGYCYLWQPGILWTHVLSDLIITIAYYAIPIILALFLIKRKQIIPFPEIVVLFVAFIFLCGTTHLFSIYVTWYPAYEVEGWLKAMTALVSIITALVLAPKLPQLVAMPGVQQAYEQSQRALRIVEEEKAEMHAIYHVAMDREAKILALKAEVNALLEANNQPAKYRMQED